MKNGIKEVDLKIPCIKCILPSNITPVTYHCTSTKLQTVKETDLKQNCQNGCNTGQESMGKAW